ncbi:MAG TPA: PAS domain S-box protein [Anaerolineales bacterium]|nr:PAS domain S-box protein [Anaerolineales bacterium]
MSSVIRGWLQPPVFPEDENKTRIAGTLHAILLISLVAAALYAALLAGLGRADDQTFVFALAAAPLVFGLWHLMRRGYVYLASTLLVSLMWLNLTVSAIVGGYGIQAISLFGYTLIVIAAGLLISGRSAVFFALLNTAAGLFMVYLDNANLLPERQAMQMALTIWAAQAVFSITAALVLRLALNSLHSAIRRASLNESYYRMLFEEAPDGICIVDAGNTILMVNAALYQMTGYGPHEILGRSALEFITPQDLLHRPPRPMDQIMQNGSLKRERVLVHKDGSRLSVIVSSNYMPDGQFQYIIQDITERKRFEDALRASEEKFAKSFRSSPDAITISSINTGEFLDVNDGFLRMSGYSRQEALGHSAEELHIWKDPNQRRRMVELLQANGQVRDFETILIRKSGEQVNCLLSVELLEIGGRECMLVTTRDITERKRIEEELRLSEERYRLVSSVSSDYTFSNVQNEKGEIVLNWVAGAFEQISGYTFEEFNARGGWVSTLHPDDLEQDARDIERLHNNQRVVSELRTIHKDGTTRWVRSYAHPVWDSEENRLVGIYGAVQDITDRKRIEQEREDLIRELEAKNAELEQFTYTVSHDLKAPLITINGFLGFLAQDALSGDVGRLQADIHRIKEATDKMHRLLNDLLELSRIGRLMNAPAKIAFRDLVEDARGLLQGRLGERGVSLLINADLPDVYGDRQRLLEVVQNLIDNAAKFMGDQPQPLIEIGQHQELQDNLVTLYVRDNGIGIAPEFHARIFGLFNRLDPQIEGTGVGLALVKRIVEFHGGRIWVESEAGQGAVFCFSLPQPPRS